MKVYDRKRQRFVDVPAVETTTLTTDWNTATTTGFYTCANTCSNAPLAQALFGEVFVYTNNDILQRVYFNNVIYRQEFVRHRYSGTWTNWTEISEQIEVSDWNNAVDNGFYYCGASTTNAPTTGSYLGTVVSKRAAYDGVLYDVSQTLEDISGASRKVWNRFKLSAGAWSTWAEVAGGAETNLANRNTKKGEDALLNVNLTGTGGFDNSAYGYKALNSLTTGDNNIALGSNAGISLVDSSMNIILGNSSVDTGTASSLTLNNVHIGNFSGRNCSGSQDNTTIGHYVLESGNGGWDNCALGNYTLNATTGGDNTAIGYYSLNACTTGSQNTFIGAYSGTGVTTGTNNIGLGYESFNTLSMSGSNNVGIGYRSFFNTTTGHHNTCIGDKAGYNITTGSYNVVLGAISGSSALTGNNNTFINYTSDTGNISDTLIIGTYTTKRLQIDSNGADLQAAELFNYKAKLNLQTGTTYTLASTDTGKVVDHSNASAITVTLPNNLPVGFCCTYSQTGAGQVTFSAASGATLNSYTSKTKIAGQYAAVTIWVRSNSTGTNAVYVISGAMA